MLLIVSMLDFTGLVPYVVCQGRFYSSHLPTNLLLRFAIHLSETKISIGCHCRAPHCWPSTCIPRHILCRLMSHVLQHAALPSASRTGNSNESTIATEQLKRTNIWLIFNASLLRILAKAPTRDWYSSTLSYGLVECYRAHYRNIEMRELAFSRNSEQSTGASAHVRE